MVEMRLVEGPGLRQSEKLLVFALYVAVAILLQQFHLNDAIQVTNGLVLFTSALGHLAVSRPLYRQGMGQTRLWGLIAGAMAVVTVAPNRPDSDGVVAGILAFVVLDATVEALGWGRTRFGVLKSTLLLLRRARARRLVQPLAGNR
ncbi:MAG: hypothetical protein NVSMB17_07670 [Candidatus Dormibacteria bacterium]